MSSPQIGLSMQMKMSVCFRSDDFSRFFTIFIELEAMVGVSLSKCKCISIFLFGSAEFLKFFSSRVEWWFLSFMIEVAAMSC